MATAVYCMLRTLQRQQREASVLLLRLPTRPLNPVNIASFSQASKGGAGIYRARQSLPVVCSNVKQFCSSRPSSPVKKEDSVDIGPGTWQEVYHGILATQIKIVKLFSLSTSIVGISIQPVLLQSLLGSNAGVIVAMASFMGFFTFVTPFLIHWITKKYVTCLHYDQKHDIYSATTLSFFVREKKIQFTVDDVKIPDVPGMFTTFLVKQQPLFVDPNMFKEVEHYGRLMGFDKPIDFHLGEDKEEEKK